MNVLDNNYHPGGSNAGNTLGEIGKAASVCLLRYPGGINNFIEVDAL